MHHSSVSFVSQLGRSPASPFVPRPGAAKSGRDGRVSQSDDNDRCSAGCQSARAPSNRVTVGQGR